MPCKVDITLLMSEETCPRACNFKGSNLGPQHPLSDSGGFDPPVVFPLYDSEVWTQTTNISISWEIAMRFLRLLPTF